LPCDLVSALIFYLPFSACSLALVAFLLGWRYSIIFHERARSIEGGCSSRPGMDDDDLDTSEYYRDAQSFRALKKRKSKTDSTADSGESCSKQNKAVDLLPVILESKTGREVKAYSLVFIHNCLEKCIGSYKSCSPLRNGNLIVKCCNVQQMTTLLQCTKLTDGGVSVEIAASSLRPLGARGVIYNVPLDISTDDLVVCFASQGVKFMKRFRFKSSDSSELKDSKSVFLQFTTADLPGEVKIGYLFFRVKQYVPTPLR